MAIHIEMHNGKLQGRVPQVDELTYEERKRRAEEQRKKDNQRTLNDYKLNSNNPAKGTNDATRIQSGTQNSKFIPPPPAPVKPELQKEGDYADVLDFAAAKAKRSGK